MKKKKNTHYTNGMHGTGHTHTHTKRFSSGCKFNYRVKSKDIDILNLTLANG